MKKRIGTSEEIARNILDMSCRELVVYCHPDDHTEMLTKLAHNSVIEALSVVNCTLAVKPTSLCWREEYILAANLLQDINVTQRIQIERMVEAQGVFSGKALRDAVSRAAVEGAQRGFDMFKRSEIHKQSREFKAAYDELSDRMNDHQLLQEAQERAMREDTIKRQIEFLQSLCEHSNVMSTVDSPRKVCITCGKDVTNES